jgi:bifunctional non-homologous end joining protein LigD
VAEDENGRSDFSARQADLSAGPTDRMVFHAFDLLHLDGRDLRGAALLDRKALLAQALDEAPGGGVVRLSEHLKDDGATLVSHACRLGLEGMIAKRGDAPNRSGRSEAWLKLKCASSSEFVIGGYTPSTAVRGAIGSLIFGVYEDERLLHVGRTGTGSRSKPRATFGSGSRR